MDLFELFERDTPERDRPGARPPRKGIRGLFDRLAAALDGDEEDRPRDDERPGRDRRRGRRDEADLDFD
ncbi:MAG: hypothetical protein M9925_09130 [Chloroflexi bacterium]|nr:hypothetical protein [Chloroflexota bacterium]MCZ7577168.1 hypothetical protein [Dehalococcoidia bacterium]NJD64016.1 hypothetical protein [Chloroflexota bacterium]PWB46755.1 MAG: hypothetical protein C3F10_03975 [Dehalococcoidia bacterium]